MRGRLLQGARWVFLEWDVVALSVLLIASFALQVRTLHVAAAPMTDEGVHVEAGRMILEGYVPYRDFSYLHPPVLPLFSALGMSLFDGMYGVRFVYLLLNTLSVAGFFAVIRRLTGDRGVALLAAAFLVTYHEMIFHDWRFLATRQFSNVFFAAFLYLGVVRPRMRWSVVLQCVAAVLATLTIFPAFVNVALSSAALTVADGVKLRTLRRYAMIIAACVACSALLFVIPGAYDRLIGLHADVAGESRWDRFAWLFLSSGPNLPLYFFGMCGLVLGGLSRPNLLPMCAACIGMVAVLLLPGEFLPHYVVLTAFPLALGIALFALTLGTLLPSAFRRWSAVLMLPVLCLHLSLSLPSLLREWNEDPGVFWRNVDLLRSLPEPVLTFQEPMYAIEAGKRVTHHYMRAGRQSFSPPSLDELRSLADASCSITVTSVDSGFLPDDIEIEWEGRYEQAGDADWKSVYRTHNEGCDDALP